MYSFCCVNKRRKFFCWGLNIHIYSQQTVNIRQMKAWLSPESDPENQCTLLGFLTGMGVRSYLQEQKLFKKGCITKDHPNMHDRSQSYKLGTLFPVCRQLKKLESALSRYLSWSKPLLGGLPGFFLLLSGNWSGLRVFFVVWLFCV